MWCFNIRDSSHLIRVTFRISLLECSLSILLKGAKSYSYWICCNVIMFYRGGKKPCTALTFIYFNPLCTGCNNSE